MNENFRKLKDLLTELFQLDAADLDFGIYRIMNQKRDEIVRFLEHDLLPQVRETLQASHDTDVDAVSAELRKLEETLTSAGVDPSTSPKVQELRARLAQADITGLENEVFSHLTNFFRRYYDEGDFISLRRYKPGVYAIPYEGEEVKLHWANADQYYIKTTEYFRDYTFTLPSGKRAHFRLAEADTERDNNQAQNGNDRRFILCTESPVIEENGELIIRFEYRQDDAKRKQADLNADAVRTVMAAEGFADWQQGLATSTPTAKNPRRVMLEKHLTDYTERNTFDYFIHKDLNGFLRRELDFFIKNEVLRLDDIEEETAPRVEQYLAKVKALRRIGHKIISFLAQIEDFQKRLWLKKKFIVEANYCATLDRVPEELFPEIIENQEQIDAWKRCFDIEAIPQTLHNPGYSEPLTVDFIKANRHLVIDTKFFTQRFTDKLLDSMDDVDDAVDGLLVSGENFQALNILLPRYQEQVKCIYIDPPYNKENDKTFAYKDNYKHSSWLAMISDRLAMAYQLLTNTGITFASIDDHEVLNLSQSVEKQKHFSGLKVLPAITNLKGNYDAEGFVATHEYVVTMTKGPLSSVGELPIDEERIESEWSEDEYGLFKQGDTLRRTGESAPRSQRPKGWFPVFISKSMGRVYVTDDDQPVDDIDIVLWPVNDDGDELSWTWSKAKITEEWYNLIIKESGDSYTIYKKQRPGLDGRPSRKMRSFLYSPEYSSTSGGNLAKDIFGFRMSDYTPKSVRLIEDLITIGTGEPGEIMDFFAGSGTTGHAAINLIREGGKAHKYILVEMGDYFDTVLKLRIMKVIYSKDWKDGKPVSREGIGHIVKYIRLESYEDTLNNLALIRTSEQGQLLDVHPQVREEYMLQYVLDVESRGSASLLNIEAFEDPFNYTLNISTGSVGETKPTPVDLIETFNYLLGLRVKHVDTIRGFRVVQGTNPRGERVLVIWRNVKEQSSDDLDAFFQKQGYNTLDMEFDLIYVNGDNHLENLRREDETWKVRLIDEEFQRLMFDVEDV